MLGRRLVYDFPQYYNIFGRTSTSAGIATVQQHQPPGARGLCRGGRHQDRLHQGGGLQPRLLGAARQQAGDRGGDRRQVDRLAQRRGRAADGRRLLQDAGDGAGRPPPPLRRRSRGGSRRAGNGRRRAARVGAPRSGARARRRSRPRPPGRCRGRWTAARSPATARRIAAAIAEVNAELDRRAGDPQRARCGARVTGGRCRGRASHAGRRGGGRDGLGLDLRGRRPARARPRRVGGAPVAVAVSSAGDHRRQRLGRAARRLPRQGRRRAAAADHRAQGRAAS